jgi:hypothetical protein
MAQRKATMLLKLSSTTKGGDVHLIVGDTATLSANTPDRRSHRSPTGINVKLLKRDLSVS